MRCETAKIKIRKTNLECPLESTKAKNGGWKKRRLNPNSVRPCQIRTGSARFAPQIFRLFQISDYGARQPLAGAEGGGGGPTPYGCEGMPGAGEGAEDETNNSKIAKRTWNVLWNQRKLRTGWENVLRVRRPARCETTKSKIRRTNLECPLESTKPKNECGRGTGMQPSFREAAGGPERSEEGIAPCPHFSVGSRSPRLIRGLD